MSDTLGCVVGGFCVAGICKLKGMSERPERSPLSHRGGKKNTNHDGERAPSFPTLTVKRTLEIRNRIRGAVTGKEY